MKTDYENEWKKDGVLMACYACLLVIGGLLTWLKYDYNAVKMEDVREACGYVSASATPVEAPKIALTFDDGQALRGHRLCWMG